MRQLQIREWGSLPIGPQCVTEDVAKRLVSVAARAKISLRVPQPVLAFAGQPPTHTLKAGQVVGVLAVPDATLEILPKVDGAIGEVRTALVHMLATAWDLSVAEGELTSLSTQRDNLLELLIGVFARRLLKAVQRGLPRRYVGHEEDLPRLRGRLDVKRQFTHLLTRPDRLACRFEELSEDVPLNRVLKAAVTLLRRMVRTPGNTRLLAELAARLAFVGQSPAPLQESVRLDRTNTAFHDLHRLACVFLAGDWQTTNLGDAPGFALLFPMNDLFERFVARKLQVAVPDVVVQQQEHHALMDDDKGLFALVPDIVVAGDTIIDTKWKTLKVQHRTLDVSQPDVYQMLAYANAYKAKRLILLYPWYDDFGDPGIMRRWTVSGSSVPFEIATVDVGKPNDVAAQLRSIVNNHVGR